LALDHADVDEAAECLGDGVLADPEVARDLSHTRVDGESIRTALGLESEFLEHNPGQGSEVADRCARGRQHSDRPLGRASWCSRRHGPSAAGCAVWNRES
jgi:hypothetical protein